MSSFANNQQNPAQELSPEALARKLEKNRLNKLKLKEKKRLRSIADRENGTPDGSSVPMSDNQIRRGIRTNSEGSSSSDMVKNILGIKAAAPKGKREDRRMLFLLHFLFADYPAVLYLSFEAVMRNVPH